MPPEHIVHIVDDDVAVLRSLERLLCGAGLTVASYGSAEAFSAAIPDLASGGCLVVDVSMPGMDGLELQMVLKTSGICLPVIILTGHSDVPMAVRAMKAGAVDFIEKPYDGHRLLEAIGEALGGTTMATRKSEVAVAAKRIASLSRREREVLDAIVGGRQSKVIAYDLGLSVRTIEFHRARMLERLGQCTIAEAVKLAVMAGLSEPGFEP
jgi:two-component system response regulator FixJ